MNKVSKNLLIVLFLIVGFSLLSLPFVKNTSAAQFYPNKFYCGGSNYCVTMYPQSANTDPATPSADLTASPTAIAVAPVTTPCTSPSTGGGGFGGIFGMLLNLLLSLFLGGGSTTPGCGGGTSPLAGIGGIGGIGGVGGVGGVGAPTTDPNITSAPLPTTDPNASPLPTGPASITEETSTNWAGYVYSLPSGATAATVTTTWVISTATCSTKGIYSPWPGFGGWTKTSQGIAQLGVDYDCKSGTPKYRAWSEAYPADSVYYDDKTINPGDTMVATVTYKGNNSYDTEMKDTTQGWTITAPMSFKSLVPDTGEVIGEVLDNGQLPGFTPINFTTSQFSTNGQALQDLATGSTLTRVSLSGVDVSTISGGNFTITKK